MTKRAHGEPMRWLTRHLTYAEDECLLWPFNKFPNGYGKVSVKGRGRLVHRVICERAHGPQPAGMTDVAHSCGVRGCVNPKHLRWATHKENMQEMIRHGRSTRGTKNSQAKLSEAQVLQVYSLSGKGKSQESVGLIFGVSRKTVSDIWRGHRWAWLTSQARAFADAAEALVKEE